MLDKLPDDIKNYIYKFLDWENIRNIENKDNSLIIIIKSYNKNRSENNIYRKILCNVKYNLCFYCYDPLEFNYLLNICSYCKYKIDDTYLYPLVCRKCIRIKHEREWLYRKCKLCNNFCGYLGILPYS